MIRINKPTPQDIADLIAEDGYGDGGAPTTGTGGVSTAGQMPLLQIGMMDAAPSDVQDAVANEGCTTMRMCAAVHCAHNVQGERCELSEINIDERGCCQEFEPAEAECEQDERYSEEETDVGEMPVQQTRPPQHNPEEFRTWKSNVWVEPGSS